MNNDITKLMQELGLPEQPRFVDRTPPRVADLEQIRAFHAGTLSPELADEVEDLIALFREWHDAERQVLIENLAALRERAPEGPFAATSADVTTGKHPSAPATTQYWSHRTFVKPVAIAAAFLFAATVFLFVRHIGGHRFVAELDDGSHHIALLANGQLTGLPSVNESLLQEVKSALTNKRVRVLAALPKLTGARGAFPPHSISPLIQPYQTVVTEDRPLFAWRMPPDSTAYIVSIYDSNSKLALQSEPLLEPKWTPTTPLMRGETYSWEVSATVRGKAMIAPPAGEPRPAFRVMEAEKLSQLKMAEREAAGCHVVLGVLYANEGLLDEAEAEFTAIINANPTSQIAKELFDGVHQLRE